MRQYIDTFMRYRSLLTELVSRDLKTKYRRSALGLVGAEPIGNDGCIDYCIFYSVSAGNSKFPGLFNVWTINI